MRKIILYVLIVALVCVSVLGFTSCDVLSGLLGNTETPEECVEHTDRDRDGKCDDCSKSIEPADDPADGSVPDLSGISLKDATVSYDGEEHSIYIEGALPEGVSVEYVGNGNINAGVYPITAKLFYNGTELTDGALTATLTIKKAVFDASGITLSESSGVYDKSAHNPVISVEPPVGVSVSYSYSTNSGEPIDEMVSAGSYLVKVSFTCDSANYEAIPSKILGYTIDKATYDMSGVRLISVTKTYDGNELVPTLSGSLPEGVTAALIVKNSVGETVDRMIDAGVYTVYATFTSNNGSYHPIDPISATFTITKYQLDGLEMTDLEVTYDGEAHTILVSGVIPDGVRVVYEGGDKIAVGEYEITARFYLGDVELTDERLSATLTITKATIDMSGISATDKTAEYNGAEHTPTLSGTLPEGVGVVYTYTDAIGNAVDRIVEAGAYLVTATFVYDRASYNEIYPMTFSYTVIGTGIDGLYPESLTKTYDGIPVKPTLVGELPEGIEVVYTYTDAFGNAVDEIVNVGRYTVVASFVCDESIYDCPDPVTFIYTVTRATYDLSGVALASITKTYDGTPALPVIGTLPAGLTAELILKNHLGETVSEMLNAGRYSVTVRFDGDFVNYYPVDDMTTTVVIERAAITGISFRDQVFSFDGETKSIYVTGAPEWLEITYSGNGVYAPGTYTVTASFSEHPNYLPIAPMLAKIIIEASAETPVEDILFEEYGEGYAVSGIVDGASVVAIPDTYNGKPVLSIKSYAFFGNKDLVYVYIPSSVVNIGNKAFADCESLLNVEFGNIKVIGQQAFKNTAIKQISLPESLETIGFGAFEGTRLERITLPFVGGSRHTSNAYIGFIFGGSSYAANSDKVPSSLTSVTLSNGCKEIPSRAFYGLTSITEVVIGRSVEKIGIGAFQGCSSLRNIYIPSSVTSITANAKAENSPFYGAAPDMMIVAECEVAQDEWGQYFSHVGECKRGLVVYGKSYEDYVINKESYRVVDETDATLSGLYISGLPFAGFDPTILEYTVDSDINSSLPVIDAVASVYTASLLIEQASVANGSVATVTVVSMNGENTLVYKIRFNVTGSFTSSAEVVNKNDAKGTVTFVVDDGYKPTASFMKSMIEKYSTLSVTYAIATKNFLTSSTEYTTDNGLIVSDIDGDGMMEYVLDENGRYTYVRNEENIDFWRDIIAPGRSEIIAHSHTHAFWGVNDEGGAQLTASTKDVLSTRIFSSLTEGSVTKEVYASMQIIEDIFGRSLTYVNGGIPPKATDTVVTEEVRVYLSKQTVRVLNDTEVYTKDGKVYLTGLTWVNLQSTVGTLPADTSFKTTADTSSGIIPAGTPIYLSSDYVTVPVLDADGNQNVVKGFQEYLYEIYEQALLDGTLIGARTAGQRVYVASNFKDIENRIHRAAYIIGTSTNGAMPTSWKNHIDNAIAAGGWSSFCIHAMVEDISEEGQGAHKITWEQAEALFKYAVDKGDDLWIATQSDATLYYHQWSTSTVTSSYDEASATISVTLTDEENDELYNMPLTVKLKVPGTWSSASVNGEILTVREAQDGSRYVLVDVAPETTVNVIGK